MTRIPSSNQSEVLEILMTAAKVAFPIQGLEALIARLEAGK